MEHYRLFFSWQNDRKDTKSIIHSVLNKVSKKFQSEGIDLIIDQDTRDRVGKRKIDTEVLEKILKCDIFLADLTPVITCPPKDCHALPKHMPNSNVMYEYGYALHAKGESRMIVLASLDKNNDEHLEFMPFDINHDTITLFSDEKSLDGLQLWIRKIMEDVDKERAAKVPQHACTVLALTKEGFSDEITIKPKYKRVHYRVARPTNREEGEEDSASIAKKLTATVKAQNAFPKIFQMSGLIPPVVRVISKTTNYSYVPISLRFFNQGSGALDNLKISIEPSIRGVSFKDTNEDYTLRHIHPYGPNDTIVSETMVFMNVATINPDDSKSFNNVYVHVPHDAGTFELYWNLNSRSFQAKGELTVKVEPEYVDTFLINEKLAGTDVVEDYTVSE